MDKGLGRLRDCVPPISRFAAGRVSSRLTTAKLADDAMSQLFQALVEATEEAIYKLTVHGHHRPIEGRTVEALPVGDMLKILRSRRALRDSSGLR
jgi:hypothetical protein